MLTQTIKGAHQIPLGLFPTYCLDTAKTSLRASFEFGGQLVVRNSVTSFNEKNVATSITVASDRVQVATGQVVILKAEDIAESEFAIDGDITEQGANLARVAGGVMSGRLLKRVDPVYPASAKASQTSGTVILHAVIGADGRVHSLRVVSDAAPDFVISAIAAVRKWIYKPYLLNGDATDVDTTITVNFVWR